MRITMEWPSELMYVFSMPWANFQNRMQADGKDSATELRNLLLGNAPTPEQVDHTAALIEQIKKDITAAVQNWRQP